MTFPSSPIASGIASGIHNGTTAAMDTTGATLLILTVGWSNGVTAFPNITDSLGNSGWIPLTAYTPDTMNVRVYYLLPPSGKVGAGHTFSVSCGTGYMVFEVTAWSGNLAATPYHSENGASTTAGTSLATGSVTPPEAGCLIVTGVVQSIIAGDLSINGGFTIAQQRAPVSGDSYGGAQAYLISGDTSPVNPTWTKTGANSRLAASIAVFRPAAGGGDTTAPILSSPTGTQTGSTTGSGTVDTNDITTGTLYYLASTNVSEDDTTVKAAASQAVTGSTTQNVTFSGLTPSITYYPHYLQRDAAGNDSAVVSGASFTTTTGGGGFRAALVRNSSQFLKG